MITQEAYAELLERCLRLEAARLGVKVDPPAPKVYAPIMQSRRLCRKATEAEIATMRRMRAGGVPAQIIADRTGFSDTTVRRLTKERHDV